MTSEGPSEALRDKFVLFEGLVGTRQLINEDPSGPGVGWWN